MRKHQAQQRCLPQVHAVGAGIEIHGFARQARLAPYHLQRFVETLPDHRRAQDIVAINHPLQRFGKGVQTRGAVELELRVQHVWVALLRRQMVVEHAFLKRRQRVDVLHIRRAPRDGGDDTVDGRLVEVDQGQHVRRDPVGRAQPVTAMLGDQFQQSRLVGDQLIPQRIIQRLVVTQDDQVAFFQLQTDRMGGNRCQ